MKKIALLSLILMIGTFGFSQSLKERMAAKLAAKSGGGKGASAKVVDPPEGEYSDPSGISGTYHASQPMPYGDGRKVAKVIKLEFIADKDKLIMHAMKNEDDPSVLWMEDYMKYARDHNNLSQFRKSSFSVFTVEPGVAVFGKTTRPSKETPGYHSHMIIADTNAFMPVLMAKDATKAASYSKQDAIRIFGERATTAEIANVLRIGEKTPMPRIGTMTSDQYLIDRSIELMKAKWSKSKEPERLIGTYIFNNDWGKVQYGKILDVGTTTFSDEFHAIMIFRDPDLNLYYYYSVGISRESTDISAEGIEDKRGLHMTGNSTIQYVSEDKVKATLAQIGQ